MSNRDSFDICIVGAGVVGLAIAYELAKRNTARSISIVILDQEASFGQHVSSRNSEVIHAGIYYPPESLKAKFCVPGKEMLYAYCEEFAVAHRKIGKLIVATSAEADALEELRNRALANGVQDLELLSAAKLRQLEPSVKADLAILSPSTGIIDSHDYMQSLLHQAQILGVQFSPLTRVERIRCEDDGFSVGCLLDEKRNPEKYRFHCRQLVNAAGLEAQALAGIIEGVASDSIPALHYCKGEYFDYRPRSPFRHLIYPMPESNTVGLGIHATLDMGGQLKFGPDTEYIDSIDYNIDPSKASQFADRIACYYPAIRPEDLKPAYSGIRPKLAAAGAPAADYVIQEKSEHGMVGLVQLFGMESPALTSSLAIARYVAERLET